jgi:hypothetical protein
MENELENVTPAQVIVEPKVLYNLTAKDMKNLVRELQNSLRENFSYVHLGFTRFGTVCITAVPQRTVENWYPTYRMFFRNKIQKEQFNLETLVDVVLSQIEK